MTELSVLCGLVCNNVMYVELKPDMLYRLTFPEEMEPDIGLSHNGETDSYTTANMLFKREE